MGGPGATRTETIVRIANEDKSPVDDGVLPWYVVTGVTVVVDLA